MDNPDINKALLSLRGLVYEIVSSPVKQSMTPFLDMEKDVETALIGAALRIGELQDAINTPELADFDKGVPLEAAHQVERWGASHDAGKAPLDWFWLIGYLAQKAATAAMAGDMEKAKHHTISTAAALRNWHAALSGHPTSMRPGIDPEARGLTGNKAAVIIEDEIAAGEKRQREYWEGRL